MYTLGVNLSHHSSIALLEDNKVVLLILEERLNRKKNCREIPFKALSLLPKLTKTIETVIVVQGSKESLPTVVNFIKQLGIKVNRATLRNQEHHLHHAATSFYMSHFDEASCLVIDGSGSAIPFSNHDNKKIKASETTSIFKAEFPSKIGSVYKKYTIGLYDSNFNFKDNFNVGIEVENQDIESFKQRQTKLKDRIVEASTVIDIGFKYTMITNLIGFVKMGEEGKTMGLSAYGLIDDDPDIQMAFGIQKELEQCFVERAKMCESDNIVIGGGCALNILGNSLIKKTFPNKNVYVDPIAADGTVALGAAALHFYHMTKCSDKLVFDAYGGSPTTLEKDYIYELTRKYSV